MLPQIVFTVNELGILLLYDIVGVLLFYGMVHIFHIINVSFFELPQEGTVVSSSRCITHVN
jgi:hypothetical protein